MNKYSIFLTVLSLLAIGKPASAQPWQETSLKDIRPSGWLLEKLNAQKEGLTGHPEALSYPYNTCLWAGEIPRMGDHGRDWWRYEQTAYYTDGLLRLGYLLDDKAFIEKGQAGISYTLEHPWESGRLGSKQVDYTWPFAVFFRAIKAAYDVSPDQATLEALARHYHSIPMEQLIRKRDILSLEGMLWTAEKTGDKALVERADSAFRLRTELLGDTKRSRDDHVTPEFLRAEKPYNMHGVTMSEILKLPILLYAATENPWYKELAIYSLDRLYEEDGLPDGLFTSAEWLQGKAISHSHETCNTVDMSWTLGYYLEVLKDARYGDLLEKIVFNAGAGSVTQDFKALQYYSSVNQFLATGTSNHNKDNYCSTWMAYRPTHQTECCAGNIHRLFPNYAARMWLRGKGEAVAALYGPSSFRYSKDLTFIEETDYPYGETVTIKVKASKGTRPVKLTVRIPAWCNGASLLVNGTDAGIPLKAGSFVTINRRWANGDQIVLSLPMTVQRQTVDSGNGVWFERGPLVYSYAIPATFTKDTVRYANMNGKYPADDEAFPCWDIQPAGPWNFGVEADAEAVFKAGQLMLPVRPIAWDYNRGPNGEKMTPDLPESTIPIGPVQYLSLVPYGQTTLRLTVFPLIQTTPAAPRIAAQLHYNTDGKFKILQLTDTHVIAGDPRSERTLQNLEAVLDAEKPDFVIHTGDVVYGQPAGESAQLVFKTLADRGIPFAVALGNHDSDFDLSRADMYDRIRSMPGNVNTPADPGISGCSNDILTLSGDHGLDRVFYLFDSGNRDTLAGVRSWGYIRSDQAEWYRNASNYFKNVHGGEPVPSFAFFHIPVPEFRQALHDSGKRARFLCGNIGEEPASPVLNSGLYVAMREQGDVQGIATGHDHNNDFVLLWHGFFFIYGRYSGCDTVYNDLKPNGARVFEFTEGDPGIHTWIRLCDGRTEQDLHLYPGMQNLSEKP